MCGRETLVARMDAVAEGLGIALAGRPVLVVPCWFASRVPDDGFICSVYGRAQTRGCRVRYLRAICYFTR